MISDVRSVDAGDYQCVVQNLVGLRESGAASLTVHVKPFFMFAPRDVTVPLDGMAKLQCRVGGEPVPVVKWYKDGTGSLPPRAVMSEDNTLVIPRINPSDQGLYVCEATNIVGSVSSSATVIVHALPQYTVSPTSLSVGVNDSAQFHCHADGSPPPQVLWTVEGSQQLMGPGYHTEGYRVAANNTLSVGLVTPQHAGYLLCLAVSEAGGNSARVALQVISEDVIPPPPSEETSNLTLSPPEAPQVTNVTQDSVSLSWTPSPLTRPVVYSVLYYCVGCRSGWMMAASGITSSTIMITDLKPATAYVFSVRYESTDGQSAPSKVSEIVHTLNANARKVTLHQLNAARSRLSATVLLLKQLTATTSTAVKVVWQILSAEDYVEGIYLRFSPVTSVSEEEYSLVTVLNAGATSYTVTDLKKYTRYRFFLVPFYKTVEGRPSNSRVVRTLEDVPSAPPEDLEVGWFNDSTAFARWGPPPPGSLNGNLVGYKIQVQTSNKILATMSVNASTTLVTLHNASPQVSVRVSALTRGGAGPFTSLVDVDPPANPPSARPTYPGTTQALFVVLLAVSVLICALTFVLTFYWKRRKALDKEMGHCVNNIGDLSQLSLMGACKDSLWTEGGWVSLQGYQHPLPTPSLSTFYSSRKENPTPYATTTLVNNREVVGQIVPVNARTSVESTTLSPSESWMSPIERKTAHCTTLPNNNEQSQLFVPPPPPFSARSTSQIERRGSSPPSCRRFAASVSNTLLPVVPSRITSAGSRLPPPLHLPPPIPGNCPHSKTTPSSQEQLDNYCNCSLYYMQPENESTHTDGAISTSEIPAQYSQLHLAPCGCNASWDESCSCSSSSCSYAQANIRTHSHHSDPQTA